LISVTLKNIKKRYGKVETVHGVNLEILPHEFIVLVGPSGCGKSTILRMIAGLDEINEGKLFIGPKVVNDLPPKERQVAMVFQSYALYPHMNVYENMAFGLKLSKTPKEKIESQVQTVAKTLGLTDLLHRKPSMLSGGQRQRVAMGRALVRNPKIFLFDEPLSNLDAKLRNEMRTVIKRLHSQIKTTTIYVTHDQVEAMTLADRIVVLKDGYIEQVGTPSEIFEKPSNTFVAQFIGTPSMNILQMKIVKKDSRYYLTSENGVIQMPLPNNTNNESNTREIDFNIDEKRNLDLNNVEEVLAGIRPEDISLTYDNSNGGDNDEPEWNVTGKIEMVEPLGSKSLLQIRIDKDLWIAEIEGRRTYQVGDQLKFHFNLNHLNLFNTHTQKSIY